MHMRGSSPAKKRPMISLEAFNKNPDGSWTSTQNSDIISPNGIIRLSAGMVFKKDRRYWGIDVVAMLEEEDAD